LPQVSLTASVVVAMTEQLNSIAYKGGTPKPSLKAGEDEGHRASVERSDLAIRQTPGPDDARLRRRRTTLLLSPPTMTSGTSDRPSNLAASIASERFLFLVIGTT
jgi:hypothetical protein